MKSFRGTFIFTIIVVAACAFSYFEVFKKGNEETEQKEKDSLIFKLKAEEITQIELLENGETIALKKTGDNWAVEKPVADKADATAVKNFLDSLLREKTTEVVDENEKIDYKTYGLDHPTIEAKLTGANKIDQVKLGSVKAYDGSTYVIVGDQKKVMLAPSYLGATLTKKANDFRNKNLFTSTTVDADHIEVSSFEDVSLVRDKETWRFEKPTNMQTPAATASVQSFLDQLRNLKGTEIVSDSATDEKDLKKFFLDKALVTIKIHRPQQPNDYELRISDPTANKDRNVYLVSSDTTSILKGTTTNAENFKKTAFDFTDKHQPFTFGTVDVVEIKISTSDFKANLKKVGAGWQNADASDKRELDVLKVEDLLGKFSHLEAKSETKSSESLANQILLQDGSGKEIFKMNWGSPQDDKMAPIKDAKGKIAFKKFLNVKTSKSKTLFTLAADQINTLGYKDVFKKSEPVHAAGTPAPPPGKASLDQRTSRRRDDGAIYRTLSDESRSCGRHARFLAHLSHARSSPDDQRRD